MTRFAPSPTGRLHLGHVRAALVAGETARQAGGRVLLRIEDIDPRRCRAVYASAILQDLAWLGLDWDGPVRVQSAHLDEYRATLDALAGRGLLYPCFCSRADIAAAASAPHPGPTGATRDPYGAPIYPGTCRNRPDAAMRVATGEPHALRLDMARALATVRRTLGFHDRVRGTIVCRPERFGDIVLARRDIPVSYHLCVTHDDAVQGVTLVTRGEDLLDATDIHRLLQTLMGWPEPDYAHHALLRDAAGIRLAKRDLATTIDSLRRSGLTPADVRSRAVS